MSCPDDDKLKEIESLVKEADELDDQLCNIDENDPKAMFPGKSEEEISDIIEDMMDRINECRSKANRLRYEHDTAKMRAGLQ